MSQRPLLISDCDEVLLHMVVPFRDWLEEKHAIHFDLGNSDWSRAITHKHNGEVVARADFLPIFQQFFDEAMKLQTPINGAVTALNGFAHEADIAILTNLSDAHNAARTAQLADVGLNFPVFTNQGGKGEALARLVEKYQPTMTIFIDDLGVQHESVSEHVPDTWRLQLVGEPLLADIIPAAPAAHFRVNDWQAAKIWIQERLAEGLPATKDDSGSADHDALDKLY